MLPGPDWALVLAAGMRARGVGRLPWAAPLAAQLAVLGGLWVALCAVFYTVLGYTAERTLAIRPTLA